MYTIFCIDFEQNPLRMNVFMNWMQDQGIGYKPIIGCYNYGRENAFIVLRDDFEKHIRNHRSIRGQESFLHISGGNKMEAVLEWADNGQLEGLGCLHEVCEEEAMMAPHWSYRPDMKTYWIAKKGNPDKSLAESKAKFQQDAVAAE